MCAQNASSPREITPLARRNRNGSYKVFQRRNNEISKYYRYSEIFNIFTNWWHYYYIIIIIRRRIANIGYEKFSAVVAVIMLRIIIIQNVTSLQFFFFLIFSWNSPRGTSTTNTGIICFKSKRTAFNILFRTLHGINYYYFTV